MSHPADNEIRQLLARAKGGNSDALAAVFEYVTNRFERVAARMRRRYPAVAAREGTGDLFHPALMKLLGQYRDDPGCVPEDEPRLKAHVEQVLRDVSRDRARKYRGPGAVVLGVGGEMSEGEPIGGGTSASGKAMRREEVESVRRAVAALPSHLGVIVRQYYSGRGMTLPEIAKAQGVSAKTVSRRLKEAFGLLKVDLARTVQGDLGDG